MFYVCILFTIQWIPINKIKPIIMELNLVESKILMIIFSDSMNVLLFSSIKVT